MYWRRQPILRASGGGEEGEGTAGSGRALRTCAEGRAVASRYLARPRCKQPGQTASQQTVRIRRRRIVCTLRLPLTSCSVQRMVPGTAGRFGTCKVLFVPDGQPEARPRQQSAMDDDD